MRTRAWRALTIAGIVAAIGFWNPAGAVASVPTTLRLSGSFSEVDDQTCSFDVLSQQSFTADVTFFYDTSSNLVRSINHIVVLGTFSANGVTLVGMEDVVHTFDFTTGVNADLGLAELVRLPDGGAILVDAGRVLSTDSGDVLFASGMHPRPGDVAAFCSALSG
jgi:hypothetical protein